MVLSTHAVIGGAVASLVPGHPVLAFTLGFISHFVADAIPHWHYKVASIVRDKHGDGELDADMVMSKHLPRDLIKISFDGLLGLFVAFIAFASSDSGIFMTIMLGAFGGMLPDALQFAYWKWRHEPLVSLQKFHIWIHAKADYNDRPIFGPAYQVAIAMLAVVFAKTYIG